MFAVRVLWLFFVLLFIVPTFGQMTCADLLGAKQSAKAPSHDELKNEYLESLNSGRPIAIDQIAGVERRLAYFEAYSAHQKLDFPTWIKDSTNQSLAVEKFQGVIKKLLAKDHLALEELDALFLKIYKVSNGWNAKWAHFLGPLGDQMILKRLSMVSSGHTLRDLLVKLGIVKDPTFFRQTQDNWANFARLGLAVFGSYAGLNFLDVPLGLFVTHFAKHHQNDSSMITSRLGKFADTATLRWRRLCLAAMTLMALNSGLGMLGFDFEKLHQETRLVTELAMGKYLIEAGKDKVDEKLLQASLKTEYYKIWSLEFESRENRPPDMANKDDLLEWIRVFNEVSKQSS